MEKIIIVNSGSTSSKYALYFKQELKTFFHYEKSNQGLILNEFYGENILKVSKISQDDFSNSFKHFISKITEKGFIQKHAEISGVSFRIVSPGNFFLEDRIIDRDFLSKLDEQKKHSMTHVKNLQNEIFAVMDILPNVNMYAVSDSAFHKNREKYQKIYALPKRLTEKYEFYRYGYHGLSVESAVSFLREKNMLSEKIIVCHLGGGSSITGVVNGQSTYNSMGYSPLSGIPMSSRIGNIDPELLITLAEEEGLDYYELRSLLYKDSGVKGMSNLSEDTRILLNEFEKNEDARNAVMNYVWSIKREIGALVANMNGLNTLIFTGTIGERSEPIRKMICEEMNALGIILDDSLNLNFDRGYKFINSPNSDVSIMVMETNEMTQMNKNTLRLIDSLN